MSPSADTMVSIMVFVIESLRLEEGAFFVQRGEIVFSPEQRGFPLTLRLYFGIRTRSRIVHLPISRRFALRCEGVYGHAAELFSAPERFIRSCFEDMLK